MTSVVEILLSSIVIGGAVFYVALLLKDLAGPFDIADKIRQWLKVYTVRLPGTVAEYIEEGTGFYAKLFNCIWCLSTWVAIIMAIIFILFMHQPWWYWIFEVPVAITISGKLYTGKEVS